MLIYIKKAVVRARDFKTKEKEIGESWLGHQDHISQALLNFIV